ncbi:MAG: bifunctional D-glycero-beta-D-manno-heptose-7-phosphate kinase/D-glycero-beta-D-manno-heptose 1-phosphate adenylyltransferase HldE [Candidatus Korobacteraceae bacterium]
MIPELREILALVESGWHRPRVLVVGDVMLDQYIWGEVERISPEAPVPVVRATLRDEKPGGAANVAMNLAGLGGCVALVGFAGGDREQQNLETLLADHGIEPSLITIPTVTTTKLRILSGHQQMMRVDSERTAEFSPEDYQQLLQCARAAMTDVSVVVLSDYAKGVLTEEVCQSLIVEARHRRIPVLVDPKSRDFARYRGATAICPNLKELAATTGEAASDVEALLSAGQVLVCDLGLQYIAVTLGEKGIAVLQQNSRLHAPAVVRLVYDVSGAGDTVIAVLALAAACDVPVETAIALANTAAGIVVSKVGTVPIQREELLGALSQQLALGMDEKLLPHDRLLSRVSAWRAAGESIVFTNGCFDILHIGHICLLEQARRKGDRLIVGLNSDDSVRRLKGPLRPIVPESERGRVLAALGSVDAVVVFDEDTPLRLIEAIRPDVLVKGGDYTEDAVVGAREVRAWGGRVELIPLVGNISTSRLIAKSVNSAVSNATARSLSA